VGEKYSEMESNHRRHPQIAASLHSNNFFDQLLLAHHKSSPKPLSDSAPTRLNVETQDHSDI
jgi:hypothetical protein